MRFSSKQYPILDNLSTYKEMFKFQEDGFFDKMHSHPNKDKDLKGLLNHCSLSQESKTIDFLSIPFFEKISNKEIFLKLTQMFTSLNESSGILLYPRKRFSTIHAVSYLIFPAKEKTDTIYVDLLLFSKEGIIANLLVKTEGETTDWRGTISDRLKSQDKSMINDWVVNHIQIFLSTITFKQFAEIETKEIGGKDYPKKVKIGKEKYLNESPCQINVLDSKWFTHTVRSDGFKVSGHFRLQPFGEGMKKRKLIYIEDFEKSGYTSTARITKTQ